MFKKTLIAMALAAVSTTTFAADYYVVVPVKGKTVNTSAIQVALSQSSLPSAVVGTAYSYNFNQNLQVTGDSSYSGSGVTWSVISGNSPTGTTLTNGSLAGTPTTPGSYNFTVQASYRGQSGAQAYSLLVGSNNVVLQAGGYRTWSNGTFATSCASYASPVTGYSYTGATGDGTYRIQPPGQMATDVYCDMTTDGGGWTMIVHGGAPGSLTGATWNVASSVNPGSITTAANNATASKLSDSFIAAIPRTAGYRFNIYGGTGSGTTRYVNSGCTYQHASAIAAGTACNYSYDTVVHAQAATSTGRYGGGGKTWHFGFSDDSNAGANSLYLITDHRIGASDNALWYTGNGNVSAVTNASQGGRYRLWLK